MRIWAIVPVKPLVRAKSRLAGVLSAEKRQELAEDMLRHTLTVLKQSSLITGLTVVSRDSKVLALARDHGALTVVESGTPELNAALLRASEVVRLQGAEGVLVVPADIPLLAKDDIEKMIHMGRYNTTLVIAPDRTEDGTNALLVSPPGLISYSFGPGSFHRHQELARTAGASVKVYRSERIQLDVDTPGDLELYRRLAGAAAHPEHY